jgi:alanine racemase
MSRSAFPGCRVSIDLQRVARNAEIIRRRTERPLIAVIKADAYGLGAAAVVRTLAPLVDGWYAFRLAEAVAAGTAGTGKSCVVMLADESIALEAWAAANARPAVWSAETAAHFASLRPVLSVNTGMHRFAADADQIDPILAAAPSIDEAMTHASRPEQAAKLKQIVGPRRLKLHAAASALLDEPPTWLDAVRPGLALFRGAVRVTAPIVELRRNTGPAGYGQFEVAAHGVILGGYSAGWRTGPCVINGRLSRVIEVGMQSAFVEVGPGEKVGDEVVLLGDGLDEVQVAQAWNCSPHEALLRLARSGKRSYVE